MTSWPAELILYGVFRELLDRRVPLGVPDYLDAIRALRAGFGLPPGRDPLRRLARTLWARSDDERRLIDALFAKIPSPAADELADAENALAPHLQRQSMETGKSLVQAGTAGGRPPRQREEGTAVPATEARVAVEFHSSRDGLALPRLALPSEDAAETYVMQPQTVVNVRTLATLWRRFRAFTRTGNKTEFDPEATLAERCRQGVLVRPVFRARRRNLARLLILADVSTSMTPWLPFLETVARSLPFSRLRAARVFYFTNLPRRSLFAAADLTGPVPLENVFAQFLGAGLLIISDSGAARGYLSQRRVRETVAFLARARQAMSPPAIVWLNPMPRDRWTRTTAEVLARRGGAAFLSLDRGALIRVVDILRGARTA